MKTECPMLRMTVALEPAMEAGPITQVPLDVSIREITSGRFIALRAGGFSVLLNEPEALALGAALRRTSRLASSSESPRANATEGPASPGKDVLLASIHTVELSGRAENSLRCARVKTIGEALELSPRALLRQQHFGQKTFREICRVFEKAGAELPPEWARHYRRFEEKARAKGEAGRAPPTAEKGRRRCAVTDGARAGSR
jgi:hypothetical protein